MAPEIGVPLSFHWYCKPLAGVAVTEKVTDPPSQTVWGEGGLVMAMDSSTLRDAVLDGISEQGVFPFTTT